MSACGRRDLRRRSSEHSGPFLHGTLDIAATRLSFEATLRCHLDTPSDVDRRAGLPTPGTQRSGHARIADPIHASAPRLIWNTYSVLKVRTMTTARDEAGELLQDSQELTPFGCFLRPLSLDELSELLNVLKGEMNLVGPRPLLTEYLIQCAPEPHRRHTVLPGIAVWVLLKGRNALMWGQKHSLDL